VLRLRHEHAPEVARVGDLELVQPLDVEGD
jgi:hypothetical protein